MLAGGSLGHLQKFPQGALARSGGGWEGGGTRGSRGRRGDLIEASGTQAGGEGARHPGNWNAHSRRHQPSGRSPGGRGPRRGRRCVWRGWARLLERRWVRLCGCLWGPPCVPGCVGVSAGSPGGAVGLRGGAGPAGRGGVGPRSPAGTNRAGRGAERRRRQAAAAAGPGDRRFSAARRRPGLDS